MTPKPQYGNPPAPDAEPEPGPERAVPCPACGKLKLASAAYCLFCGYAELRNSDGTPCHETHAAAPTVPAESAPPRPVPVVHLAAPRQSCVEMRGCCYTLLFTLCAIGLLLVLISIIWMPPDEVMLIMTGVILLAAGFIGIVYGITRHG